MDQKKRKTPRPWWMINGAPEPLGDVFMDRYFHEWIRMKGEERNEESAGKEPRAAQGNLCFRRFRGRACQRVIAPSFKRGQ